MIFFFLSLGTHALAMAFAMNWWQHEALFFWETKWQRRFAQGNPKDGWKNAGFP